MENLLFTFTQKKPFRISCRATSNKQKETSDEQKVTSKEQKVTSKEQQAKSNEQRAKSNGQRTKSNEQRAKSNEQRTKSNEQRATSQMFHLCYTTGEQNICLAKAMPNRMESPVDKYAENAQ